MNPDPEAISERLVEVAEVSQQAEWAISAAGIMWVLAVTILVSNFGPERATVVQVRSNLEAHRVLLGRTKTDLRQVNEAFGQAANELVKMREALQSRAP